MDIHGKIVVVFDQKKLNENEVLVVIEEQYFDRLKEHLKKYLSLSETRMEATDYLAYFDLEGNAPVEYEHSIPQKKGRLLLDRKEMPADVSEEAFTLFLRDLTSFAKYSTGSMDRPSSKIYPQNTMKTLRFSPFQFH